MLPPCESPAPEAVRWPPAPCTLRPGVERRLSVLSNGLASSARRGRAGTVPLAASFRDLLPALLVQDQGAPGTFRIPPRPVPQREEERRLKLPVRGGGHGPGAVTFAGRGLCLPLPSGKPWGGGWSAHWIAVTWSRRSGTGEAGDPTPTPGSKGTGRGCCHQERGGRAGPTQSGLSAHPQRSVSASSGVWALAAHFPGPLTHWASDPPKGRGRGPLRPGQCGSPGRRSGRLGLASGWEYVLSSLLRPVSDHSLCSGVPGRRTDQGHSSDSAQKLRGPRRPVGGQGRDLGGGPGARLPSDHPGGPWEPVMLKRMASSARPWPIDRVQLPVQLAWVNFLGGGGEFQDQVVPVRRSRWDVARTPRTGLSEGRKDQRSKPGA